MKDISDAVVIGAGPCGSFAALNLAKMGHDAAVFEEHNQIGVPSHCAGHLSIKGLKDLGLYPLPKGIVENTFCGANFYSPKGNRFTVRLSSPITCTINRALFDKHVAEKAEHAGADFCLGTRVEHLIIQNRSIGGVIAKQEEKIRMIIADITINAEGISARMTKEANLSGPNRRMLVNGVEAEAEKVKDLELDMVNLFFGKTYAPGFYAWLIPKGDEKAKIGLAAKTGNPKDLLHKLVLKHPVVSKKLSRAKISNMNFHPISLGGSIPQTYSGGFLAVGDAASQVKPTTGGGVVFGMTCAKVAAEVAHQALDTNDTSSESLSVYQESCGKILSFDVKTMLRMRKTLDAMSDEKIDYMIRLCTRLGLDKTLQSVKDIDFQGQTLLRTLRSPRMLTALGYFLFAYLSANP